MRRRPEAYHARLLASAVAGPVVAGADDPHGDGGAVATIHDIVRSREPGLAARLRYDVYERRSGLVHLFAPGTTAADFAEGRAVEPGDAVDGAYDVVTVGAGSLALRRDVALDDPARVIRVDKRFVFGDDRRRPTLDLEVSVENRSAGPVRFDLGVEWALTMLGGGGNPAAYYRVGAETVGHDSTGEHDAVASVVSGNTYVGLELSATVDRPAAAWWSPIETISNSEFGFERVYQGSALVFVWPVELAPGARLTVSIRNAVDDDARIARRTSWQPRPEPDSRQPAACAPRADEGEGGGGSA